MLCWLLLHKGHTGLRPAGPARGGCADTSKQHPAQMPCQDVQCAHQRLTIWQVLVSQDNIWSAGGPTPSKWAMPPTHA